MTHPREAALAWLRSALSEELRLSPQAIDEAAETIDAIASDYGCPTEDCVRWIHEDMRAAFSPSDFVRYCAARPLVETRMHESEERGDAFG